MAGALRRFTVADALARCVRATSEVGGVAIVVDALEESVVTGIRNTRVYSIFCNLVTDFFLLSRVLK
jgi:hypothetical protein